MGFSPTIVYVAGYGRSGSTVLDIVLGNQPRFFSAGELTQIYRDYDDPSRLCSCGHRYPDCEVWSKLKGELAHRSISLEGAEKTIRAIENREGWWAIRKDDRSDLSATEIASYREVAEATLSCIDSRSVSYLVDSSKSAADAVWRPMALRKWAMLEVRIIHLQRSLKATLRSIAAKSNWQAEGFGSPKNYRIARGVVGWVVANRLARQLKNTMGAESYLFLKYEDLLKHPRAGFESIGKLLGTDLSPLINRIERGDAFPVGHNVGGNRVRLKKEIQFGRTT